MPPKGYKRTKETKSVVTRRVFAEIGEQELKAMLESRCGEDTKADTMLGLMKRPPTPHTSTARLMQLSGYSRAEIVKMYGEYKTEEMRIVLARGLPGLAEDLVVDSKSTIRTCGACKGAGIVMSKPGDDPTVGPLEETCIECSGQGTYRTVGDIDSRKMVLEVSGLVKKGGGFGGVNINMGAGASVDSFDSMISRANDMLEEKRTVNASAESVDE